MSTTLVYLRRALSLGILATCVAACDNDVTRAKADSLASSRLQQYAKQERLEADQFTTAVVTEHDGKWLYSYEYRAAPKQSVAIIVSVDGRVEVSRMLDGVR